MAQVPDAIVGSAPDPGNATGDHAEDCSCVLFKNTRDDQGTREPSLRFLPLCFSCEAIRVAT